MPPQLVLSIFLACAVDDDGRAVAEPGIPDAGCTDTWCLDADGDGFGDRENAVVGCAAPAGHVADTTDCDDGDAAVHPGAAEVCGGGDEDCDGRVDDEDAALEGGGTWYLDQDGDDGGVEGVVAWSEGEDGTLAGTLVEPSCGVEAALEASFSATLYPVGFWTYTWASGTLTLAGAAG